MMRKAFKFKLYPTPAQVSRMERALGLCCELYNACLEQRRLAFHRGRHSINAPMQMRELPDLKRECPELGAVYSQVLQDVLWRVDLAFQQFFRRVKEKKGRAGFPRFRSHRRYDSLTYPQLGFKLIGSRLHLSKMGNLKVKLHRPIEGTIKTCTLKRELGEWFVIFSCELLDVAPVPIQTEVGIDVGLESFAFTSEGEAIPNPRLLEHSLQKLRRAQRSLARKPRGSQRRNQQVRRVALVHQKIARQRRDFHHKVARHLVSRYDLIGIEDLNVQRMLRNRHLARGIADVGWASFATILASKAEEAGKRVEWVSAYRTSQVCSRCGTLVPKDLAVRWHRCPHCGLSVHRDHNSAREVLARAKEQMSKKAAGAPPSGVKRGKARCAAHAFA